MIISHKYKLVFVEFPRTGSTAIGAELKEHYGGQSILRKHSHYSSFLRIATDREKKYFVVSGIRNPLDDAVSWYEKYRSRPDYATRRSKMHRKRYRYVHKHDADFATFLRKFYKIPYDNWTNTYHKQMDLVIRFENLQDGFSQLVSMIGTEQVRQLPMKNRTTGKLDFEQYYGEDLRPYAVSLFGPYMRDWGYEFPETWSVNNTPVSSRFLYAALRGPRKAYWTYVRQPDARFGTLFRKMYFTDSGGQDIQGSD